MDTRTTIAALGGLTKVSRALGYRHASTVQGWKKRNRVPIEHAERVRALAADHGLDVRMSDLVIPPDNSSFGERAPTIAVNESNSALTPVSQEAAE